MPSKVLATLFAVCLLLGAAIAVPPVPATGTTDGDSADHAASHSRLDLDEPSRSGVTTQSLDVGAAVESQRVEADARLNRRSLQTSFDRLEDDQERREFLLRAATDVEIATSELRTQQRELRSSYLDGEVSAETYVSRQNALHDRATRLSERLQLIRQMAEEVPQLSLNSRTSVLRATLLGFNGPVVERTRASTAGEAPATKVYVATSINGSVVATIVGGEYVREAYRDDHWTPDSTEGAGFDSVIDRVGDLYPEFDETGSSAGASLGSIGPDGTNLGEAGIYRIGIQRGDSSTTAYLDSDTLEVFSEVERYSLSTLETGPAVSAAENGVRLTVNRTFAGGPLRIAVTDDRGAGPIEGRLYVGDPDEVRTGSDGTAWTLMPGDQTEVTAVTDRGNVSVAVEPA